MSNDRDIWHFMRQIINWRPNANQQKWLWAIVLVAAQLVVIHYYKAYTASEHPVSLSQFLFDVALVFFNIGLLLSIFQTPGGATPTQRSAQRTLPDKPAQAVAGQPENQKTTPQPEDSNQVANPQPPGPADAAQRVDSSKTASAETGSSAQGSAFRPGYAFLLAVGLFASALALYEAPARTANSGPTTIALMPSPSPTPSPATSVSPTSSVSASATTVGGGIAARFSPSPLPTQAPIDCTATLGGLNTLTLGSSAIYDLSVTCDQPPKKSPVVYPTPSVEPSLSWITVQSVYGTSSGVPQDEGKTFRWRFLVEAKPSPLPSGVTAIQAFLAPRIETDVVAAGGHQPSPVLAITIKQSRTIDNIKDLLTSAGAGLAALMSLLTGLVTFAKGQYKQQN